MKSTTPRLTFYYRENCHLCDDMWRHLRELQTGRDFDFELVRVDVDSDNVLQQRFGTLVPVLLGDDRVICNYYLDPEALERYLTGVV